MWVIYAVSGLGRVRVGRIEGFLVLVLVLDWTQCLPQGAGALPAIAAGSHGWLPPKTGWLGLRGDGIDGYNLHSPPTVAR